MGGRLTQPGRKHRNCVVGGQYTSHCYIVTGVRDGSIDTIGGNVGDGVATRSFTTDANGMINDPVKDWIAVLAPQMLGTN